MAAIAAPSMVRQKNSRIVQASRDTNPARPSELGKISTAHANASRNSGRSLDIGRRRARRARRGHADRRRTAAAVVVSRCRRGADQHRRGRTCRRADLETAQRAIPACRRRYASCRRRMPQRALFARRRQAAGAGLGRDCRDLQNPRSALRAAAHQFSASPRRRLQGARLQAGTRRRSGRADGSGTARRSRPRPMPRAAWSR